jgi:hypothetical protein
MRLFLLIFTGLLSLSAFAGINDCSINGFGNMQLGYVQLHPGEFVEIPYTAHCLMSCGTPNSNPNSVTMPLDSCSVSGPTGAYFNRGSSAVAVDCPMSTPNVYYFVACLNQ